jgi:hypothetical protein
MAKHLLVVLSNATEGQDEAFNQWYTNTHLGDVLKVPGYVAAQRFKLSEMQLGPGAFPYRYMALYEVETDNLEQACRALTEGAAGSMYIDPALDRDRTVAWFYSPITERVESTAARSEQTVP